jgi:hypothetical protein
LIFHEKSADFCRATALATIIMIGQTMGIASAKAYRDAPRYKRGNGFALGGMLIGVVGTGSLMVFLKKKNVAKFDNQGSEEAIARRTMTIEEIQDNHPDFFYYI